MPIECTKLPDGPEPVVVEIEYPSRDQLQPVVVGESSEGEGSSLHHILNEVKQEIQSTEWADACAGLLMLRRLTVHHPTAVAAELPTLVPHVIKSARSLRSALSKTAFMTLNDLYVSCPGEMLPLSNVGGAAKPLDSALAQLLLKCASNDKKFVVEEAQRTLETMAERVAPTEMVALLSPAYVLDHKNPKVRGKAAVLMATCLHRLSPVECHSAYGMETGVRVVARLITDNTPDAREGAKRMAGRLKMVFEDPAVVALMGDLQIEKGQGEEEKEKSRWEGWVVSVLGPSKALPVLRATGN